MTGGGLAEERARSAERRDAEMVRARARRLLDGRWDDTSEAFEAHVREEFPKMNELDVVRLVAAAKDLQRKDRPRVDPTTVRPVPVEVEPKRLSAGKWEAATFEGLAAGTAPPARKRPRRQRKKRSEPMGETKPRNPGEEMYVDRLYALTDEDREAIERITQAYADEVGWITATPLMGHLGKHGYRLKRGVATYLARKFRHPDPTEPPEAKGQDVRERVPAAEDSPWTPSTTEEQAEENEWQVHVSGAESAKPAAEGEGSGAQVWGTIPIPRLDLTVSVQSLAISDLPQVLRAVERVVQELSSIPGLGGAQGGA